MEKCQKKPVVSRDEQLIRAALEMAVAEVENDHFEAAVSIRFIDPAEVLARLPPAPDAVARLVEALKPFAEADKYFDSSFSDDYAPSWAEFFTIGDFRRARTALNDIQANIKE